MNQTDAAIIGTQGLGKTYGEVTALKSLALSVPKNFIFGWPKAPQR